VQSLPCDKGRLGISQRIDLPFERYSQLDRFSFTDPMPIVVTPTSRRPRISAIRTVCLPLRAHISTLRECPTSTRVLLSSLKHAHGSRVKMGSVEIECVPRRHSSRQIGASRSPPISCQPPSAGQNDFLRSAHHVVTRKSPAGRALSPHACRWLRRRQTLMHVQSLRQNLKN
jgi:hypothetical protein